MANKTQLTDAIVLKRTSVGETDRIVTLLTPSLGKISCVAKGVRKMSSSQRAFLEPGNLVSVLLIFTQNMPLITQSKLLNDFAHAKHNLTSMKRLVEVLEIIDVLFAEGVEEEQMFEEIKQILDQLDSQKPSFSQIQKRLIEILVALGYQHLDHTPYNSVLEYVSSVAEKPLKSYDYMTVKD